MPPFTWLAEADVAGFTYRATVVDQQLVDHHPQLPVPPAEFVRGDANDDLLVDIADPVYILAYLFQSGATPHCREAADTNDDGQIDISDPVYELGYLFIEGAPMPLPFPACGLDPLALGTLDCGSSTCQ